MRRRMIRKEVIVNASLEAVWDAWVTPEGAVTFFAPKANINLAIGGPYELFFDVDAPEGSRGGEGLKILSFLPMECFLSNGARRRSTLMSAKDNTRGSWFNSICSIRIKFG